MNVKKLVTGLLAAMALSWAQTAYAQSDNGTEFGIADDLSVYGTTGTATDPDLEVKGFSVFGATAAAYNISASSGNVVIAGNLQVSATSYFGGMYVAGVSSFTDKVYMQNNKEIYLSSPSYIYMDGGATNQVLKKDASGALRWAEDLSGGAGTISGTPNRIQKIANTGEGLVDSAFLQSGDGDASGVTMVGSSMSVNSVALFKSSVTILGDGSTGIDVTGAAMLNGALTVGGVASLNGLINLGNGAGDLVTIAGPVTSVSSVTVQDALEVDGAAKFDGSIELGDNSSDALTVNAKATFLSVSSFSSVDNMYVQGGNTGEVLSKKDATGQLKWTSVAALGDNLGNHVATTTLNMATYNIQNAGGVEASSATLASWMIVGTSATITTDLSVGGNAKIGNDKDIDTHGINMNPDANTALAVAGPVAGGSYAAKFYAGNGTTLSAWLKNK